jgi:hypothetical protein
MVMSNCPSLVSFMAQVLELLMAWRAEEACASEAEGCWASESLEKS